MCGGQATGGRPGRGTAGWHQEARGAEKHLEPQPGQCNDSSPGAILWAPTVPPLLLQPTSLEQSNERIRGEPGGDSGVLQSPLIAEDGQVAPLPAQMTTRASRGLGGGPHSSKGAKREQEDRRTTVPHACLGHLHRPPRVLTAFETKSTKQTNRKYL